MSKIPIDAVQIRDRAVSPALAEVWISLVPHWTTPDIELRGKLTGPRSHFATTVEVAYPLRPIPKPPTELPGISAKVIIPDPCLWEPASPFLYQGFVELWDDGKLQNGTQFQHGLRILQLGPRGLRINNRLSAIRGFQREPDTEKEALQLRLSGCNLLLASSRAEPLWALADRLGFLMLGRVGENLWDTPAALAFHPWLLRQYASSFGWLLGEYLLDRDLAWWDQNLPGLQAARPPFFGMELTRVPVRPLPQQIDFIVCTEDLLPSLRETHRPKLVLVENCPSDTSLTPGILGWIQA